MSNRFNKTRYGNSEQVQPMRRKCIKCREIKLIEQFPQTNNYIRQDGSKINWRRWTCRKCMRNEAK